MGGRHADSQDRQTRQTDKTDKTDRHDRQTRQTDKTDTTDTTDTDTDTDTETDRQTERQRQRDPPSHTPHLGGQELIDAPLAVEVVRNARVHIGRGARCASRQRGAVLRQIACVRIQRARVRP